MRLPWIFTTPMVEAPDEFAHYWVLKFICEHMRLPLPQEVLDAGPSAVYGSMPQMGYLPHIIAVKLLPFGDISLTPRFGSAFMGVVTTAAAYLMGKELFPERRLLALALPLFLIFHPQLVLVQSYSNNDATACALASIVLLLVVRTLKLGPHFGRSMLIGGLLGWLALSKYSGLAVWPVSLLAVSTSCWLHSVGLMRAVNNIAVVTLLPFVSSCWWFIRNSQLFGGDVLGTNTMRHSWSVTYKRPIDFYMTPWQVIKQKAWWKSFIYSFWGLFGYMSKFLWRPANLIYFLFMIGAGLGGVTTLVRDKASKQTGTGKLALVYPAIWWTFGLCILVNLAAVIWASTANLGGPQGRYLFTSEVPIIALIMLGLSQFGRRVGDKLVIALLVFNVIVCIAAYIWLFQLYGGFRLKTY